MKFFDSCTKAITSCIETQTYSLAHLLSSEHTMDMHIHDCCEVYYSVSGGKKFLINNHLYDFEPGDIFLSTAMKVITSCKWRKKSTSDTLLIFIHIF